MIDGKDLTPILMNKGPSLHDCLIHYYSPQSAGTVTPEIATHRRRSSLGRGCSPYTYLTHRVAFYSDSGIGDLGRGGGSLREMCVHST